MKTLLSALLLVLLPVLAMPIHADGDTLLVIRHRWHTGLALPADQLDPHLSFLRDHLPEAPYYEFGWGDEGFYRHADSPARLLKALFWPTNSVLHVAALERHPADLPHKDLTTLCLDQDQWRRLAEALAADFQRQPAVQIVDQGLYGASLFFRARGTFWLGHTCNSWTAQRLQQAGVPIRSTLTAGPLMTQLEALTQECPTADGD